MASDKKINIDVKVTGDASGADAVAKGLGKVEEAAKKTSTAVGTGGLSGKLAQLFPTFTKVGSAVGSVATALASMVNPVTIATTVVTAAVGAIVAAYRQLQAQEAAFLDVAGQGFGKVKHEVDNFLPVQTALDIALQNSAATIQSYNRALQSSESLIAKRLSDDIALTESTNKVTQAKIALAVAEGRLSEEEAARQVAMAEAKTAEEVFAAQAAAAQEVLDKRVTATQQLNQELEKLKAKEDALLAAAQARQALSDREIAAQANPKLNQNLDAADQTQAAATAAMSQSIPEAAADIAGNIDIVNMMGGLVQGIYGITKAFADQGSKVEALKATEEEAKKLFEDALKAREEFVKTQADSSRAQIEQLQSARAAAQAKLLEVQTKVAEAEAAAAAYGPGGIKSTIFQNNQAAAATTAAAKSTTAGAGTTASASGIAGAIAGLPASPQLDQIKTLIADGVQGRESAILNQLIIDLAISVRNSDAATKAQVSQVQREIQKTNAQLADLRTKQG